MKNQRFRQYIYWGVTAVAVIAACIAITFLMINFGKVQSAFKSLQTILMPVIYGMILAYLVAPIYNRIDKNSRSRLESIIKNKKTVNSLSKIIASLASFLLLIAIVTSLMWLLLPQLINSIKTVINILPGSFSNFSAWLEQKLSDNPNIEGTILSSYDQIVARFNTWLTKDFLPNIDKLIGGVSSGVISVFVVLKNIFIGVIVMLYLLNIKTILLSQSCKILYGVFPVRTANTIVTELRYTQSVFSGFIIGKLLDSLIIGVITFFGLSLLHMPYVILVSVIIGVTNIIPFFGPFIGAIPSAFLILLVSPIKCLIFIIFIILLQQLDGNVIGPKILGNSTGLSSFWVLFSILLFGGLFGFVGMIIAVPAFAVIYHLISKWITGLLKKKNLSTKTSDYRELKYIDEESKEYIK